MKQVVHTLDEYVASWSGLLPSAVETTSAGGVSSVRVPGVVHITSQPMRATATPPASPDAEPTDIPVETPDPTSALSFTAGVLSCSAEDAR